MEEKRKRENSMITHLSFIKTEENYATKRQYLTAFIYSKTQSRRKTSRRWKERDEMQCQLSTITLPSWNALLSPHNFLRPQKQLSRISRQFLLLIDQKSCQTITRTINIPLKTRIPSTRAFGKQGRWESKTYLNTDLKTKRNHTTETVTTSNTYISPIIRRRRERTRRREGGREGGGGAQLDSLARFQ